MPENSGTRAGKFGPGELVGRPGERPQAGRAAHALLLLPKRRLWSRRAAARRCSEEATANVTTARARSYASCSCYLELRVS